VRNEAAVDAQAAEGEQIEVMEQGQADGSDAVEDKPEQSIFCLKRPSQTYLRYMTTREYMLRYSFSQWQ
jgi:hypothetical protein